MNNKHYDDDGDSVGNSNSMNNVLFGDGSNHSTPVISRSNLMTNNNHHHHNNNYNNFGYDFEDGRMNNNVNNNNNSSYSASIPIVTPIAATTSLLSSPTSSSPSSPSDTPKSKMTTAFFYASDAEKSSMMVLWEHLVIVFYFLFICSLISFSVQRLPSPLSSLQAGHHRFSEERARVDLETIVSFGFRVAGSYENEEVAFNYLMSTIKNIQALASKDVEIEVSVQRPTGVFYLDFFGFVNYYSNITNIAVRISPRNNEEENEFAKNNALLINGHFDSTIGSPAASDDASSIAVMLEILRIESQRSPFSARNPRRNSLILLFNGAEESILPASHGFITQHEWAKTIKVFINLEGAGAGGRELLFQAGPKNLWLAGAYVKNAPYPHGTILAQEIFQTGIIPSDTDFRIFRDFGNLSGLDLAFYTNGYLYHTEYDDAQHLTSGSLQRCGENVYAIVDDLLDSTKLSHMHDDNNNNNNDDSIVYFDVLGLIMIHYSSSTAIIINAFTILVSFAFIVAHRQFLFSSLFALIRLIFLVLPCSLMLIGLISFYLHSVGDSMIWYATPWICFPLFLSPTLLLVGYFHSQSKKIAISALKTDNESLLTGLIFWTVFHLVFSILQSGFAYLSSIWILSLVIGRSIGTLFSIPRLYVTLISSFIPLLITMQNLFMLFEFFIPLMGRAGTEISSDAIVGAMFAIIITLFLPKTFFSLLNNNKYFGRILFLLFVTSLFLPVGRDVLPISIRKYDISHPKRFFIQHVQRSFVLGTLDIDQNVNNNNNNNNDNNDNNDNDNDNNAREGYDLLFANDSSLPPFIWFNPLDWDVFGELQRRESRFNGLPFSEITDTSEFIAEVNDKELLLDGLPWILPLQDIVQRSKIYENAPEIIHKQPLIIENVHVANVQQTDYKIRRRVYFTVTGSSHMTFYLPKHVIGWSLNLDVPDKYSDNAHLIFFVSGSSSSTVEVWFEVDYEDSKESVEFNIAGHYFSEYEEIKPFLQQWQKENDWLTYSAWSSEMKLVRLLLGSKQHDHQILHEDEI